MARTSGRSRLTSAVVEIRISPNPVKYTVGERHTEPDTQAQLLPNALGSRGISMRRLGAMGHSGISLDERARRTYSYPALDPNQGGSRLKKPRVSTSK